MAIPAVTSPKDRWHHLADAIGESNLPASDKAIFRYLLDKADYGTAVLPAKFTPMQADIARKTSHSRRQVRYAIRHLERHKWLEVEGRTGPGKPLRYTLATGAGCDCTGRVHTPERRQPESRTAATIGNRTAATNGGNAAGQTPDRTERQREGGVERQVSPSTSARVPPDWSLMRRLVRIVHADPCGGIHRDELAEKLHMPPHSRELGQALAIATRRGEIDWCGRYAVRPIPKEKWPA